MKPALVLIAAGFAAISACSPRGEVETAEKAAKHFHQQYNAGQYAEIYSAVDNDFRASAKSPEFVAYETGVHKKLGDYLSTELMNYNVVYLFGKVEIRLDYDTKFAAGKAIETFQVKVKDNQAQVSGYRIDSALLPNQPK